MNKKMLLMSDIYITDPAVAISGLDSMIELKDTWNIPLPTTQMLVTYSY